MNRIFTPSDEVVEREIDGKFIFLPLFADIDDMKDHLFTPNRIVEAAWNLLNSKRKLAEAPISGSAPGKGEHDTTDPGWQRGYHRFTAPGHARVREVVAFVRRKKKIFSKLFVFSSC